MSNKTRLQTNNTNLQNLITKANNLPNAGSGGGANKPVYTVSIDKSDMSLFAFYYLNESNEVVEEIMLTNTPSMSINMPQGFLVVYDLMSSGAISSIPQGPETVASGYMIAVFNITQDFSISF